MHRNWKDLIKPNNIEAEVLTDTYGKFIAMPLERGYGVTLGNSLRRILLSSLNGAAVVAARFEGTDHEFSVLPGVKEDITDIILNIKQMSLRYLGEEDTIITLKADGPKTVTAADIETKGHVEILNPDQVICTLNEEGKINCEFLVRHGRGYVTSDTIRDQNLPVGFIQSLMMT